MTNLVFDDHLRMPDLLSYSVSETIYCGCLCAFAQERFRSVPRTTNHTYKDIENTPYLLPPVTNTVSEDKNLINDATHLSTRKIDDPS